MIKTVNHNIGEKFVLLTELPTSSVYRIFRSFDGKFFNKVTSMFEEYSATSNYEFTLYPHPASTGISSSRVNYLPNIPLDLVFEFLDANKVPVGYQRHTFGGFFDESKPSLCVIYGKVTDISGRPIPNARIEVSANKNPYFIRTYANIGPSTYTVSDEAGYFQIPLIKGIEVTVSIPATGFSVVGYVPNKDSVELKPNCLGSVYG